MPIAFDAPPPGAGAGFGGPALDAVRKTSSYNIPESSKPNVDIQVRKHFPETWLWQSLLAGPRFRILKGAKRGAHIMFKSARAKKGGDEMLKVANYAANDVAMPDIKANNIMQIRKHFPETWLWKSVQARPDGSAVIKSAIPDTITSWFISAFAMDMQTGLGIAETNAKVTVFRPFFIKLSLPYSIIRGETIELKAIVFNYMSKPIDAEIVMNNDKQEFEFINSDNELDVNMTRSAKHRKRQVSSTSKKMITIPANDGVSVKFMITPKIVGYIDIAMTATTANAGDSLVDKLLVKPEGQTQYFNKALLVDLKGDNGNQSEDSVLRKNIPITIPTNAVPGSQRVSVSGIGDIMGPTVNNLDDLLRVPYGCGEQNMLNFVPNIVVLNYLSQINRLTPTIKSKAISNIESGYQRELTYKRSDGSFSAFGQSDKSGSTWLTAFVIKSFTQSKKWITVDQKVIDGSIDWLFQRMRPDGSFDEPGVVLHKDMQGGGAGGRAALTAYVLIAILQDKSILKSSRRDDIKNAESFIISQLNATKNPYDLSIIAQALHLSGNPIANQTIDDVKSLAKTSGDYMWWESDSKERSDELKDQFSTHYPNSYSVETTAYILMSLVSRDDLETAIPVLRWLVSKQNSNGGFSSTQDTVIGIQALGALAQRLSNTNVSLNIEFNYKTDKGVDKKDIQIDSQNAIVLQRIEMPAQTQHVEVMAKGVGTAIVQVSYQYNLAVAAEKPAFKLTSAVDKRSTDNYLLLDVCTHYLEGNATNMAVIEVELPSGYVADTEALPTGEYIKRTDTTKGDTNIVFYFDKITNEDICLKIPAHKMHKVMNNKPVPITVYDYYNRQQTARILYEPMAGKKDVIE